jgi:hypothetical protein
LLVLLPFLGARLDIGTFVSAGLAPQFRLKDFLQLLFGLLLQLLSPSPFPLSLQPSKG